MALMYYNEQAQSSWLPIEMTNPSLLLSTFSGVFLLLLYRIGNLTTFSFLKGYRGGCKPLCRMPYTHPDLEYPKSRRNGS